MDSDEWLLLGNVALGLYAVGNVWLVQLSSYPLWAHVGRREFHAYHVAWWHSIWGVILAPSVLLVVVSALMLKIRPRGVPGWEVWLAFGLQMALVLGTALYWGPLMARLASREDGLSHPRYATLMRSHWLRVAIVTAYGALSLWMVASSAWLPRPC